MSLDLTTDATVRIGDADREHAVAAPGRHLSVGRLTMAEFENRLDTAYAATTRADLDAVLADLPAATPPSPPPQPVPFAPTPRSPWAPRAPWASRASWTAQVPWVAWT
jgi:hypothetical protein